MSRLVHSGRVIADNLHHAESFLERSRGLLGRSSLRPGEGLWIKRCNSIHTFFMRFSIDVIFVDSSLRVVDIRRDLAPWKLTLPRLRASSVIELAAGALGDTIHPGDQLHVES